MNNKTILGRLWTIMGMIIFIFLSLLLVVSCLWFPYWLLIGRNGFKDLEIILYYEKEKT